MDTHRCETTITSTRAPTATTATTTTATSKNIEKGVLYNKCAHCKVSRVSSLPQLSIGCR